MQLDESYEILEITPQDGVVVWKARDRKTGKLIQVHLFPNEKIPEASQICARLLSLPSEARSKVLRYGPDGSSTYFITELLPEGEGLGAWVLREAAPPAAARLPGVNSGAVGNLRRMDIEPAPLQPLPPGPESRRGSVDRSPTPNAAPTGAQGEPKVRPISPSAGPPAAQTVGPGDFTLFYTKEEVKTAQHSPSPQPPSSRSVSETPPDPGMRFSQVYGSQDLRVPEALISPETAPEAASTTNKAGPGLDTFIGIRTTLPPPKPPAGTSAAPPFSSSETGPVFEAPQASSAERVSPPTRDTWSTRQTFTFGDPVPQPHAREQSELFSSPPFSPPSPASPPLPARRPTTPETRRAPEPLLSGRVAAFTALGVIAVAAIVVLIVDVLR